MARAPVELVRKFSVLGGQSRGHALQRLAHIEEFEQLLHGELHHPGPHVGHPLDQAVCLEAAHRLAKRPPGDSVGAGEPRLGDLAARGELAAHDRILQLLEDALRQGAHFRDRRFGFGWVHGNCRQSFDGERVATPHNGVNTQKRPDHTPWVVDNPALTASDVDNLPSAGRRAREDKRRSDA